MILTKGLAEVDHLRGEERRRKMKRGGGEDEEEKQRQLRSFSLKHEMRTGGFLLVENAHTHTHIVTHTF